MLFAATAALTALPAGAAHIPTCPSPASLKCLLDSLEAHGAVAVSGVPGLEAARASAYALLAACASDEATRASMQEVVLGDGTARRSLAARTVRGVPEPLEGTCNGAGEALEPLRAIVDSASRAFLGALEPLERGSTALLTTRSGRGYHSLLEVAQGGEQLEHFHTYVPLRLAPAPNASSHDLPALPLHTDAGLLLALVPAMWVASPSDLPFSPSSPSDGFSVEGAAGELLTIEPESAPSSVVFVVGEGWGRWLEPALRGKLRAAPHSLAIPAGARGSRAWYGRMLLPPGDALMPSSKRDGGAPPTYSEWSAWANAQVSPASPRAAAAAPAAEAASAGGAVALSHGRELDVFDAAGCNSNQIWCWHACKNLDELNCAKEDAVCALPDGSVWDGNENNHNAQLECLPDEHSGHGRNGTDEARFCTGRGTSMHMDGFTFLQRGETSCVIFLFTPWLLSSDAKFALAVLGTVALGVLAELLTWTRRTRVSASERLRSRPHAYRAALGGLFALQVALGYALMLIAMTYQAELLIAVVAGLALGHTLLNVTAPVGETSDPCCVEPVAQGGERAWLDGVPVRAGARSLEAVSTDGATSRSSTETLPAAFGQPHAEGGGEHSADLTVAPISCEKCCAAVAGSIRAVEGVIDVRCDLDGACHATLSGELARSPLAPAALSAAVASVGKVVTCGPHLSSKTRVRL